MKLIKNEFIKLSYQPITILYFLLLMLIISCLLSMPYKFIYLVKSDITQYSILFKFILSKIILPALLIYAVVKASSLVLYDFHTGTIKNIVVRRCSRFKIYTVRVVSLFMYVFLVSIIFIMMITLYLEYANDYHVLMNKDLQEWLIIKLGYFLLILFYLICFSMFIATIINNIFVTTVIAVMYTIFIPLNYFNLSSVYSYSSLITLLPSYHLNQIQFYANQITILSFNNSILASTISIGSSLIYFLISCLIYRLRERSLM